MAGKHNKDDDWSDSEDEAPSKGSGKGHQGQSGSAGGGGGDKGKGKNKGPSQLEFMTINEIQKVISKNEVLSDAASELMESLAQYINGLVESFNKSISGNNG